MEILNVNGVQFNNKIMQLALISEEALDFLRKHDYTVSREKDSDVVIYNRKLPIDELDDLCKVVAESVGTHPLNITNGARDIKSVVARTIVIVIILHLYDCITLYKFTKGKSGLTRLNIYDKIKKKPWIYDKFFYTKLVEVCDIFNIEDLCIKSYKTSTPLSVIEVLNIDEIRGRI